ncbi:Ribonuclease T2 domain protein [Danaus plexippus plexippus]|uniref:Ribonuclease T2 domain protein n=1 Tax=Danaus plexippus plexippus TaxID=278856 RepID=A0A212EUS0_DANPL|nr:Ribonuclease T2 domain protein [Danaus plexippus plexippus]
MNAGLTDDAAYIFNGTPSSGRWNIRESVVREPVQRHFYSVLECKLKLYTLPSSGELFFGTRGTSPGRSNSGRVSLTQTNFGGNSVWDESHPNRAPVQPPPVRVRPGVNPQFPATSNSSLYQPQPIGPNVLKSTAVTTSRASSQLCVDNTATMPKTIACAEHCFDYFKIAVAWSPGYAYKEWKKGLQNRFVDNKILGPLENTWYTVLAKGWSDNTKFWEHEFNKHGSCASRSSVIGDDVNYFKRTLELFNQLYIGTTLYGNGHRVGGTVYLKNIVDIIEDRIGATIQYNLVTNEHTDEST